jgi:hypothetical protein
MAGAAAAGTAAFAADGRDEIRLADPHQDRAILGIDLMFGAVMFDEENFCHGRAACREVPSLMKQ